MHMDVQMCVYGPEFVEVNGYKCQGADECANQAMKPMQ